MVEHKCYEVGKGNNGEGSLGGKRDGIPEQKKV